MPERASGRIAIDDIVEAATDGVLRAMEARKISGVEFTKSNGFFVDFHITCGGKIAPDLGGPVLGRQVQSG